MNIFLKFLYQDRFGMRGMLFMALVVLFVAQGCEKDDLVAIRSIETIEPQVAGSAVQTGGVMVANREIELVEYGVAYGTTENPVIEDVISAGTDLLTYSEQNRFTAEFQSRITLLSPGTYYVRAYITTRTGTAYGNQVSFTIHQ